MKIYLAGPEVFLDDATEISRRKVEACARHGFHGLSPMDGGVDVNAPEASRLIFEKNVEMMRASDAIIANLTPFRGVSADPGTVFELGFCFALGKAVMGYSGHPENLVARTRRALGHDAAHSGVLSDGLHVEDFDLPDNLMMAEAINAAGWSMILPDAPVADPWRDLTLFEAALKALKFSTAIPRAARQGDGNG
ncbi:nucleoside 2-deoxyribosyltransferase [Aquabacter sp. CN5-332]|uniref:nucleoside 2-deoxyribosyltransferase n=1 Tax=Aquabacter sp. CN5-332 TaxID=3156608 RepID=UPI0032B5FD6C